MFINILHEYKQENKQNTNQNETDRAEIKQNDSGRKVSNENCNKSIKCLNSYLFSKHFDKQQPNKNLKQNSHPRQK